MNPKQFSLDRSSFSFLHDRLKPYYLATGLILASIIVLFTFTSQQLQDLNLQNQQEQTLKGKIAVLQQNQDFLSKIDESQINDQFNLATAALPSENDFIGVINAIGNAAAVSTVTLNDFSFGVGSLATASAKAKAPVNTITLGVKGTIDTLKTFVQQLSNQFPLATISTLSSTQTSGTIVVTFPFRPLPLQAVSQPLKHLSQMNLQTIQTLQALQQQQTQSTTTPPSSASAQTAITPTLVPSTPASSSATH